MIDFLKNGNTLNGVTMGMSLDELESLLGESTNIIGEKDYGYVLYGAYRFGYTNEVINEMAVVFHLIEIPFEFKNVEYKKYDISQFEDFKIKSKTKIHKMISFINHLQLEWKAQGGINKDSLIIKIIGGPFISCNLYDGTVDKVTIVDGHQND